ncbi:M20 family metallopeptidase [Roseospira marina]|nr:M20 family metallopeptidase [Roseospira marina]MBB4314000.1 acetylornithine deacetylase/succinyl-diaminopimelate desuccinylase [Roseospira marina]MBB5087162.1 acetylornithine deacetylase/succinyl-diaminopimelate desuccinylase [Roseospira marina]
MSTTPNPDRMTSSLETLVSFNTENPPGREVEAAAYLDTLLAEAGFETRRDEFMPGRSNVIATLSNGSGPTFAFNSHIDVVPAGGQWTTDPFRLHERDGRLYGRGACDAKGPIVAMIEAMHMLAADRASWSGTLMAAFVADEETESRGAKHLVAKDKPPVDLVVIGEPTSNGTVTAHKGSLRPIVRVHGETAHSGTPDLGENAIFKAARLMGLLEDHHHTHICKRCHPLVGNASLTIVRVKGGLADNIVPDACEFMLDRRMVPGEDEEAVKREFQALLDTARAEFGVRAEIVGYQPTTGAATETDRSHPIVQASLDAGHAHGVTNNEPGGFQGGCDLVHFRSLGAQGTVIGPGSLAIAHKPNEYVPINEFVSASLIYRDVALRMMRSVGA